LRDYNIRQLEGKKRSPEKEAIPIRASQRLNHPAGIKGMLEKHS
jgi:hypothetical protein